MISVLSASFHSLHKSEYMTRRHPCMVYTWLRGRGKRADEISSGGARTSMQPGHFLVTKVVRQVIWCEAVKVQMTEA